MTLPSLLRPEPGAYTSGFIANYHRDITENMGKGGDRRASFGSCKGTHEAGFLVHASQFPLVDAAGLAANEELPTFAVHQQGSGFLRQFSAQRVNFLFNLTRLPQPLHLLSDAGHKTARGGESHDRGASFSVFEENQALDVSLVQIHHPIEAEAGSDLAFARRGIVDDEIDAGEHNLAVVQSQGKRPAFRCENGCNDAASAKSGGLFPEQGVAAVRAQKGDTPVVYYKDHLLVGIHAGCQKLPFSGQLQAVSLSHFGILKEGVGFPENENENPQNGGNDADAAEGNDAPAQEVQQTRPGGYPPLRLGSIAFPCGRSSVDCTAFAASAVSKFGQFFADHRVGNGHVTILDDDLLPFLGKDEPAKFPYHRVQGRVRGLVDIDIEKAAQWI